MQKFRAEHVLILLVALVLAAAWAAVAWQVGADYDATRRVAARHMVANAAALEARVRIMLDSGLGTAMVAARDIKALGDLDALDVSAIAETLKRRLAGEDYVHALWLATKSRFAYAGRNGQIKVSDTIPGWQAEAFDRDAGEIWIGRPTPAPFNHSELVIPIACHLPASGHKQIWAGALFRVRSLENIRPKDPVAAGSAALVSTDGTLLVSLPAAERNAGGIGVQDAPVFRKMINGGNSGLIQTAGTADDAERMFGYRKFDGYPLMAVSANDKSILLKPWRRRTTQTLELAAVGTLIFLIVAGRMLRDLTRRKRVEQALMALNMDLEQRVCERTAQLAAANTELEAFSYSVSHDLRAPVRHILGFAELAQEMLATHSTAGAQQYLGRVSNAARKMNLLIRDLLQLAKISRGELRLQNLDLSQMATQTGQALAESQPARHVTFTVQPGMTARGDPGLILIVLENLLGNAWKFTRDADHPRVEVMQQQERFVIKDNGVGFEMKAASDLFAPFQRCHSESEFEGTGIGLATVKRIIMRHGGSVQAAAAPGKGASFSFSLAPVTHSSHSNRRLGAAGPMPSGKLPAPIDAQERAGIES